MAAPAASVRPSTSLGNLTANVLLKSIIGIMAVTVMVMLAAKAWESRQMHAIASRTVTVAEASAYVFRAMHNLRIDRAFTNRGLLGAEPASAEAKQELQQPRQAEMPALNSAVAALVSIEMADRDALVGDLRRSIASLTALHAESTDAVGKPRAARRPQLTKEVFDQITSLLELLDKIASRLVAVTKLQEPFIDQMMAIKQFAWMSRNAAGDASITMSNGYVSPLPADAPQKYTRFEARSEAAWMALEDIASGTRIPPRLAETIAKAKRASFDADFMALRARLLQQHLKGEKPELTRPQWTAQSLARLDTMTAVAEAALDAAKEHALAQQSAAQWNLTVEFGVLAAALALALGAMALVTWRVIRPLHQIQHAMGKLAGGDTKTEIPGCGRHDEIGQMAGAAQVFKDNMIEADRLRDEQEQIKVRAETEKKASMEKLADEFEASVKGIVQMVSSASTELQTTARSMSVTAEQTRQQSTVVATASDQASSNVQTAASAAEELSSSILEIGRQVADSTRIAGQAVSDADRTNTQVRALAEAAQKIGDVVKLINDIAGQTNLLALNATIEAARAGEAGKGFAVVASEVKSLATQTAKATEDIAAQVKAIQGATSDSVQAIQGIGQTIGRINEIATAVAAAVEEQGAATKEIARNVQQASAGTNEVSSNIAGVTKAAADTGAAASQVLGASGELAKQSETLRAQVDGFIAKIRTA